MLSFPSFYSLPLIHTNSCRYSNTCEINYLFCCNSTDHHPEPNPCTHSIHNNPRISYSSLPDNFSLFAFVLFWELSQNTYRCFSSHPSDNNNRRFECLYRLDNSLLFAFVTVYPRSNIYRSFSSHPLDNNNRRFECLYRLDNSLLFAFVTVYPRSNIYRSFSSHPSDNSNFRFECLFPLDNSLLFAFVTVYPRSNIYRSFSNRTLGNSNRRPCSPQKFYIHLCSLCNKHLFRSFHTNPSFSNHRRVYNTRRSFHTVYIELRHHCMDTPCPRVSPSSSQCTSFSFCVGCHTPQCTVRNHSKNLRNPPGMGWSCTRPNESIAHISQCEGSTPCIVEFHQFSHIPTPCDR